MHAVEFVTELDGNPVLRVPSEAAAQLPRSGKARVIVMMKEDADESEWRSMSYEQFLREDSPEDAIYDLLR